MCIRDSDYSVYKGILARGGKGAYNNTESQEIRDETCLLYTSQRIAAAQGDLLRPGDGAAGDAQGTGGVSFPGSEPKGEERFLSFSLRKIREKLLQSSGDFGTMCYVLRQTM